MGVKRLLLWLFCASSSMLPSENGCIIVTEDNGDIDITVIIAATATHAEREKTHSGIIAEWMLPYEKCKRCDAFVLIILYAIQRLKPTFMSACMCCAFACIYKFRRSRVLWCFLRFLKSDLLQFVPMQNLTKM